MLCRFMVVREAKKYGVEVYGFQLVSWLCYGLN